MTIYPSNNEFEKDKMKTNNNDRGCCTMEHKLFFTKMKCLTKFRFAYFSCVRVMNKNAYACTVRLKTTWKSKTAFA
jgi:hypothetical protein